MVLIRKHYFVEHLESVKRREKERTAISQRISRWVTIRPTNRANANDNEKIEIHVKQPSTMRTILERPFQDRLDPSEGIGAALVGGGSAGIALGIALGQALHDNNGLSPINDAPFNFLPTGSDYDSPRLAVESPLSLTDPYRRGHSADGLAGTIADAHSFSSSPRSGVVPLPVSPSSREGGDARWSTRFAAPSQMRYRRGIK